MSTAASWLAPHLGTVSGQARVQVPGSKSLTNRYLLLAALASSPSLLRAPLHSRDSALMIQALTQLGARFEEIETGSPFGPDLKVYPLDFSDPTPRQASIQVGLAGTVMRFVPPLAALLPGSFHFEGDPQASSRPMGPILQALEDLGYEVESQDGSLPFRLTSQGPSSRSQVQIDASASSQFLSALLLVACRMPAGLEIEHVGGPIPSLPHVDMTLDNLRQLGVEISQPEPNRWQVAPGSFSGFEMTIEPDLSNAGPFLAAAVVTGGRVSIPHWPAETTQGGNHWLDILPRWGASCQLEEGVLTVTGPAGGAAAGLPGLDLDLSEAGELAPTVAAVAALSPEPSRLRGISHLRGHETDRLAALTQEIRRLGGQAEETEDGILISAPVQQPGLVHTYHDHRMATAAAIMGLQVPGVQVENVETTAKTLPNFTGLWQDMLKQLQGKEA